MYELTKTERKIVKTLLKGIPKTKDELYLLDRDKALIDSAINSLIEIKFIKHKTEHYTDPSGKHFSGEGNRFIIFNKSGCEYAIKKVMARELKYWFSIIISLIAAIGAWAAFFK